MKGSGNGGGSMLIGKAVKLVKIQLTVQNLCPSYIPKTSSAPDWSPPPLLHFE